MKRLILSLALAACLPAFAQTPAPKAPTAAELAKQIEQIELAPMAEQVARSFEARGDLAGGGEARTDRGRRVDGQ